MKADRSLENVGGFEIVERMYRKLLFAKREYGIRGRDGFYTTNQAESKSHPQGAIILRLLDASSLMGPIAVSINPVTLYCSHARGILLIATPISYILNFFCYTLVASQYAYAMEVIGFKLRVVDAFAAKAKEEADVASHVHTIKPVA